MNQQNNAAISAVGAGSEHELFALTDEQILEIGDGRPGVPPPSVSLSESAAAGEAKTASSPRAFGAENLSSGAASNEGHSQRDSSTPSAPQNDNVASTTRNSSAEASGTRAQEHESLPTKHAAQPPKWLADMMADPQAGAEARDRWSGVQQARQEAAAFREVFAKPEEARAAGERSRAFDEIDAAFYGGAGKRPEEASAARAALAQRLLREDPAAFREMVFAGLRALEEAGTNAAAQSPQAPNSGHPAAIEPARQASQDFSLRLPTAGRLGMTTTPENARSSGIIGASAVGAQHAAPLLANPSSIEAQIAAYREFEKTTNEDLERSVGGAIGRALTQALPNITQTAAPGRAGAQHGAPLQARLQAAIHEDIEAALKADRQLGEQVAQVLASRRFDDGARTQVVRLINDRAQQLVPAAARRVINDWTQATLAAHRTKHGTENSAARAGLAPPDVAARIPPVQSGKDSRASGSFDSAQGGRNDGNTRAARVDYRKLSDEQILEL